MDSAMKTTIKELLAAEQDIDENKSKTNSTNYKGGATARRSWSDTYAKKVTIINLLKATIKYCNIPKHRGKIKNTIKSITVRCKLMSLEMASEILNIPNTETMTEKETRKALKEYEKHIRKMLIIWERGTNLRARNKWRTKLKEYKKKREEQRKIPHEVKKFYNYALKRPSPAEKPEVIFDGDKILDTKEEIHKREEQYLAEFMGKQRKRWYLREGIIHPNLAKTKKGKKWRKKIQEGVTKTKDLKWVPRNVKSVFKHAKTVKNNKGETMSGKHYGNIFTSEFTLKELDEYLKRIKKNTAPGKSGIRVDHIISLPDGHRTAIAKLLSLPNLTGLGFENWKHELVNWIQKEEGNNNIDKRRPLIYYEVMRKMWMGIRVHKVLRVWKNNGIIDKDNYAFLTGLSTTQPLMIKN